jgi:phage terminase Nu1 subunit (DNA packaging protein)
MVNQEIYVLTKHAKFQAEYVENLPIYRRRHFIHLLEQEIEQINKEQEKAKSKSKIKGNFKPSMKPRH